MKRGESKLMDHVHDLHARRSIAPVPMDKEKARLAELFGEGREFDPVRIADEVKYWMVQTSMAFWEACRRIAWAHCVMSREAWTDWVQKDVGLQQAHAYRYLTIAKTLGGHEQKDRLLSLGSTKAHELCLNLDDDELRVLEDGGSIQDLEIDDIQRLTVRELRDRLQRRERELNAAKQKMSSHKSESDDLKRRITEMTLGPRDHDQVLQRMRRLRGELVQDFDQLETQADEIDWPSAHSQLAAEYAACVEVVRVRLGILRERLDMVAGVAPEALGADGTRKLISEDAQSILDCLAMMRVSTNGIFNFAEVNEGLEWPRERFHQAIDELEFSGFVEPNYDLKTNIAVTDEWRYLVSTPDIRPDWMKAGDGEEA